MSDELNTAGLQRLRVMLDESASSIDAATLSRLNRARQAALASRASRQRYVLPLGVALAASLLFAVVVIRLHPESASAPVARTEMPVPTRVPAHEETRVPLPAPERPDLVVRAHEEVPTVPPADSRALPVHDDVQAVALNSADLPDDFADLAGDEPEDLAQEDLEFYAWLDAQEAQDG